MRKLLKKPDGDHEPERIYAQHEPYLPLIVALLNECGGNLVRVRERLAQEHQLSLAYSTLTYIVRKYQLSSPPTRVGEYDFKPGEEMQHDTSPHTVILGGKPVKAQCCYVSL